ncbi:MAG: 5'-methylthioadenosine/adenosylhomocysteine nucleosidase, partial [Flavobacteriaceae bacterium]|nr:5'-methylthioadenosine/adenosylhomocysteine nucleosidase [Flavobacteriaceae bacterium]
INIGDIVIGKNLYQHDMDASPLLEPFEIPLLQKKYFEVTINKRNILQKASQLFLENFNLFISETEAQLFFIKAPRIHIENIASGDQFISTNKQLTFVKTNLPDIACVEMEGAAVAQVCYEYKIPFGIFRTISDKANDNSHVDFPKFAKQIASNYALGILKYYFEILNTVDG